MTYKLPDLPYQYNALEPYVDTQTMQIHHDKHHQAYVDNLNKALDGLTEFDNYDIDYLIKNLAKVPENVRQAVTNNGGGHANHSLFWQVMTPASQAGKPQGKLLDALNSAFGSFDNFKDQFTNKAMTVFGSGWAFLQIDADKKLSLKRHSFQNSPLNHGATPILPLDVWEHAYYLKYQNRRAEYVQAWWNIVNWKKVGEMFDKMSL